MRPPPPTAPVARRLRRVDLQRRTRRWRKTDSNYRSFFARVRPSRYRFGARRGEKACSEKRPVLGGTGSSNLSPSSGESSANLIFGGAPIDGLGVTANLTYEPPYLFARRM